MSGPAPKHPSRRARRNSATSGMTTLDADARVAKPPAWPLAKDTVLTATAEAMDDKVAGLQAALADEEDGRSKGRLRRQLDQAQLAATLARTQLDAQADLEVELWDRLWRTPQAKMWETSDAFARMLAQFVRWNVKGEQGDLKAATEARLRGKEFGLTPLTLMGLKAEIERADEAEAKGNRRRTTGRPAAEGESKPDDEGPDPRAGLYAV